METGLKKGIFYGVGVGPGDPELLTLKAIRLLERCPVSAAPRTKSGEMLALDNSRLSFTDKDVEKATVKLTRRLVKGDTSYVTLIYGADVTDEQAEHVQALLSAKLSDKIEVMLVNGGQPVYYYIISVE